MDYKPVKVPSLLVLYGLLFALGKVLEAHVTLALHVRAT